MHDEIYGLIVEEIQKSLKQGQWLWRNWQSGHYMHKRTRLPSCWTFTLKLFNSSQKSTEVENQEREAETGAF